MVLLLSICREIRELRAAAAMVAGRIWNGA